jgi:hypothetical protein
LYDLKWAEIRARHHYEKAKLGLAPVDPLCMRYYNEVDLAAFARQKQPRVANRNNWYTDNRGNLVVRTQARRQPNVRPTDYEDETLM